MFMPKRHIYKNLSEKLVIIAQLSKRGVKFEFECLLPIFINSYSKVVAICKNADFE